MIVVTSDDGLRELAESRDLFQGVRDHAATPDLRRRASGGYDAIQNFIQGLATHPTPAPAPAKISAAAVTPSLNACNKYRETVYFAFAFRQNGDWASAGWLKVRPNTCRRTRIVANYFYAETDATSLGADASMRQQWGSGTRFCVGTDKFVFAHATARCGSGGRFEEYTGRPRRVLLEVTIQADGVNVTRRSVDR